METRETVSEIITSILNENKLSQEKLAYMLGVSQKAISNWTTKQDLPQSASLLLIYNIFGITPNEMLGIDSLNTSVKIKSDKYKTILTNTSKVARSNNNKVKKTDETITKEEADRRQKALDQLADKDE